MTVHSDGYRPVEVKVWGEFACFTRPEMKVERVTYPVITPSAARGMLEAIFWKPEFRWQVVEIHVLRPIRYFSMVRNEITSRQSLPMAKRWQVEIGGYNTANDATQRHTLGLRDVAYVIKAHPMVKSHVIEHPAKFRDQFRRRVKSGRCFATPYLGCREFSASFAEPDGQETPELINEDLGRMLLDLEYSEYGVTPRFFPARLVSGVLHVPVTQS